MANTTGKKFGGRQKGTTNKATANIKDLLDSTVDFNVVIEKLFELAKGSKTEKPDANAAKVLLAYRYGQPKQEIDVTSDGKPIKQNVIRLSDGTDLSI